MSESARVLPADAGDAVVTGVRAVDFVERAERAGVTFERIVGHTLEVKIGDTWMPIEVIKREAKRG